MGGNERKWVGGGREGEWGRGKLKREGRNSEALEDLR